MSLITKKKSGNLSRFLAASQQEPEERVTKQRVLENISGQLEAPFSIFLTLGSINNSNIIIQSAYA